MAERRTRAKRTRTGKPTRRTRAPARRLGHRLATDVTPREVDLHVVVDPDRGRTYRGEVAIRVALARSRRAIELHAAGLRVSRARAAPARGRPQRASVVPHPEHETLELRFDAALPAGETRLEISFSGQLRDDLRGLYAASADGRRYAFTQLEAAEARRFFPCFDEPAMKARFHIAVTTAETHDVVSNAPVERVEPAGSGRKTVRFAPTPRLSTYLVALAVGALERSAPVRLGPTEIRVWNVPGKGKLTAFALEAARQCLARLEAYFGIPYPYGKLDLVAVPDFEAGAMENAGAVFFRETLLLVDPDTVTLSEKKRVAEVICHELAHMWYGDLVTMAWWDDLWLNEAFATWMAFHVVDRWKPEWRMWQEFQHHRAAAMRLDALRHTHPIHTNVRTPADATENFDLITYEKGASVVRMIERYLGPSRFRAGVRRYIRRHREGNARAADLWQALSEAAGEPVEPIVRPWIERPGLPLVALSRREAGDRTGLALRQERFHAHAAPQAKGGAERWPVPCVVHVGGPGGRPRLVRHLLTKQRDAFELGKGRPRFVYGNADEGGFFRPLHDAAELAALAAHRDELSAVERMGLVDHHWSLVRARRANIQTFLELADAFGDEPDPDVLLALQGPLGFVEDQLAPQAGADGPARLRAWVARRFAPGFAKLGFDPAPGEPEATRLARAHRIALLGDVAGFEPVLAEAETRFERYLADRGTLEPNLADPVVSLAARRGDAARFKAILDATQTATTPQERRRFLMALGAFRHAPLVERALRLALSPRVPTQDVALLLARLLANPAGRERAWTFVTKNWDALRRRMPPMLATRLVQATPALGARRRADVAAFFRAHPLPAGQRSIAQALERFDLDAAFCRGARKDLASWLARRAP